MSSPGYSDLEACPIVCLYRHSLELYLKAIIYFGKRYSEHTGIAVQVNDVKLKEKHSLSDLFHPFRQTFQAAKWKWESETDGMRTLAEVEELLKEFDAIDSKSLTFRYPVNTDGQPTTSQNFRFSVKFFCRQMDYLLEHLSAAVCGLEAELAQLDDLKQHLAE